MELTFIRIAIPGNDYGFCIEQQQYDNHKQVLKRLISNKRLKKTLVSLNKYKVLKKCKIFDKYIAKYISDIVEFNKLPTRIKFFTYYYLKIGWNCNSTIVTQVTDLTKQDIWSIKRNWAKLYKKHVLQHQNNGNRYDNERKILTIPNFVGLLDFNSKGVFYDEIGIQILRRLKLFDEKLNIDFIKLKNLYPGKDSIYSFHFSEFFGYDLSCFYKPHDAYVKQRHVLTKLLRNTGETNFDIFDKKCSLCQSLECKWGKCK